MVWQRWAGPAVTLRNELQESWLLSQQLQGNEPGHVNVMDGLTQWQVYFFRGNAWSNAQSSGDRAPGTTFVPLQVELPTGVRLVLEMAARPVAAGQPDPRRRAGPAIMILGTRPRHPRRRQRGAALLLAMLIVTLVATLAGAMVWQQWRAIQVEAAERARTQSAWILVGALDWARLILREDKTTVDHLGEPWAVPLAEARLSSFLAADNSNSDDGPEAFLSGSISDMQGRYNLGNLVSGGEVVPAELDALQRLFSNLGIDSSTALTIAEGLRDAGPGVSNPNAAAPAAPASSSSSAPVASPIAGKTEVTTRAPNPNPPLRPQRVEQLAWFGVDAASIQRMAAYVALLPAATALNLNTASPEVMAAVIDGIDLAGAQRLVRARERSPFNNLDNVRTVLGEAFKPDDRRMGVTSNFFEVSGRLRLGNRTLEERSLVQRVQREVTVLTRERVNLQN